MTIVPGTIANRQRLDAAGDITDVVGERTLLAMQTVNISRLSTHPVPIVPGTLLVVAGQGPKDSNGAGKSSFIAAITALLGDEQWRFASGAKAVAELLFNAELAAQGDSQWASADHGFIAGVFGDPRSPEADMLTVWLRVNLAAPHLELRWSEDVVLASAASESERVGLADKIWDSLPKSAGRRDYLAKDLGRVLYGNRVRCVSFLSTSVRSRVATNLLSQPLNEISPERIFSAIAALTGLDRELDAERKLRADEYAERARAAEALESLQKWEAQTDTLIKTFDRRDEARIQLERAREHWRSRAAQLLVDGCERDRVLETGLAEQRGRVEESNEAIRELDREIAKLRDDELDRQVAEAERAEATVRAEFDDLGRDRAVTEAAMGELRSHASELTEQARAADGRDVPTAREELAEAQGSRDAARERLGASKERLTRAERALRSAEAGEAGTPEQLTSLAEAGIDAVGLIDVVDLDDTARRHWEAALWPYRDAIVVPSDRRSDAIDALSGLPGSVLVPADTSQDQDAELPDGIRTPYRLGAFFDALAARTAERSEPSRVEDEAAGVVVIGGFVEPITGRLARVRAAEVAVETARATTADAEEAAEVAERNLQRARTRLEAASAAERAGRAEEKLADKRGHLEAVGEQIALVEPRMNAAITHHRELRARAENRKAHVELREKDKNRHEATRHAARTQATEMAEERDILRLEDRHRAWGGTEASAHEWLANLDVKRQAEDWRDEALEALDRALQGTFPDGSADPEMPAQIRLLLQLRESGDGSRLENKISTFDGLAEGLGSRLRDWEDYERQNRAQIDLQGNQRRRDFEAAQKGVDEAASAAQVGRSTVTKAIRARLNKVVEHFDHLDLSYGGYGATLDFPTPEPPADPEQDWRWRVTPKWRRSEGHSYVPYNRRANTALMDEKAVKLVCAAALASAGGGNLCLVLDELGRNLGKEHRREAVALFRQIGEMHGITVIGALQDDMEPYAIDACGEYVKLRRPSDAMPYNEPPVVVAHDEHAERVRQLGEVISQTRPEPPNHSEPPNQAESS